MSELISDRWHYAGDTQVLDGDGFFISYNPDTRYLGIDQLTGIDYAGDEPQETALCREEILCQKAAAFILNGDWRQQYEDRVDEGWDACFRFYLAKKPMFGSKWSSDDEYGEKGNEA